MDFSHFQMEQNKIKLNERKEKLNKKTNNDLKQIVGGAKNIKQTFFR